MCRGKFSDVWRYIRQMRKLEEKKQSIKVHVHKGLYDRMSKGIRFGPIDNYITDIIDISFLVLQENRYDSLDPSEILLDRELLALFHRSHFVHVRMIAELFIIPICAAWIALRCHATKLRRVRLGAWSMQLDNAVWYLFIGGGEGIMMNVKMERHFHNIFQWHFIRNLKIVDSMIPWLKDEIPVTWKQVLIDRAVEKIEKAGKNPAPEK